MGQLWFRRGPEGWWSDPWPVLSTCLSVLERDIRGQRLAWQLYRHQSVSVCVCVNELPQPQCDWNLQVISKRSATVTRWHRSDEGAHLLVEPSPDHHRGVGVPLDGLLPLPEAVHLARAPGAMCLEPHTQVVTSTLLLSCCCFTNNICSGLPPGAPAEEK